MDTAAFGGNRKLQRLELGASQDTIPCLQFLEACVWHLVMGEREVDRLNHGTTEIRTLSTVLRERKKERESVLRFSLQAKTLYPVFPTFSCLVLGERKVDLLSHVTATQKK